jgi:hypothetical protein
MAIGRLPVTEPREIDAILAKTIGYAEGGPEGDWRRRILWITNDDKNLQRRTDKLAAELPGFEAVRIFPSPDEPNDGHRRLLKEALDEGQLLVHFLGHGGRFIWRTGYPDLSKNHDLFTLNDIDDLKPGRRLPIVLSMTCYSAPFDHPNADSIGEKFLRVPRKGAVAVVAASWKIGPTEEMSRLLLEEFTRPGTAGEALQRAKARSDDESFIWQFNLLGDPALPLASSPGDVAAR